ncbi:hypothetical protein BGZ74_005716 [Mortierella antarctica]|nr:hypothetical protein BGZ74_005716 [Mortierella antarctica]
MRIAYLCLLRVGTYNDPTKKRGPPKGYIEAIEARLHKMEGLLGGLVKDKDPRAEIVRAELDAMAREAEMTGLKLRRSKAYEEINQAMAAAASEALANERTPKKPQESYIPATNSYSETHYQHHQHHQHQHQHQHQSHQQHHQQPHPQQHHHKVQSNVYSSEGQYVSGGYHIRRPMETHPTIKQEHEDYSTSFFRNSQGNSQKQPYITNESEHYQPSHHPQPLHQHHQSHSSYVANDMRSDNHSSNYDPQSVNYEKGYSHQYHTQQPSLWTSPQPPADLHVRYTHNLQSDTKQDATEMPSKEVIDHLLAVYFRHIHPVLPMLHYPTLSDQIRRQELPPSHLLFAILGLASRFSENTTFRVPQPGYDLPPCTLFYEKAKYLFKEEYDNSQIGTVQALLLMAVQQMGFCESQRAWLYVGMAIRMAQDLGLNKDLPEHEKTRNRLTSELRKRTWWSCYVVERLVCAGLGRPLTITQKECETTYPQHDDDDVGLGTGALAGKTMIASNFVHLITLSKIQGNILEFIKARAVCGHVHNDSTGSNSSALDDREPTIDISQAAFFSLDKALTAWRQDLPESLQTPTAESPHFGLFLHMTYNTLIILLHRPEVSYSATSASLCTQAAASITEITEILMNVKALTSTFISCLYAIFSAGVVHFMNIPGPRRSCDSSVSSPRMNNPHSRSTDNHTTSAKANMKRCIDALKFLASHWVSAARRAKVLEDLLDLKHVSLKDLEVDSFKTSVMEPSWAKASTGYGKILESPREGHDKLRQQCRSKMMAIHSLLADDNDDYPNARHWDDIQESGKDSGNDMDMDDTLVRPGVSFEDTTMEVESAPVIASLDSSPSTVSVQSPVISIAPSAKTTTQLDTDPMMLMSSAHLALNDVRVGFIRATSTPLQSSSHGDLSDPMMSESNPISRSTTPAQQGAMFDPFSMPSSITFPSLNQGRRTSCGGTNLAGGHDNSPVVWSTDTHTNRSTAWSGTAPSSQSSSPRSRARTVSGCQVVHPQATPHKMGLAQQMGNMGFDEHDHDHDHDEEHDLVWNDMPPTLGLDEWMAYIGAMMMRWLASGESSPRSVSS